MAALAKYQGKLRLNSFISSRQLNESNSSLHFIIEEPSKWAKRSVCGWGGGTDEIELSGVWKGPAIICDCVLKKRGKPYSVNPNREGRTRARVLQLLLSSNIYSTSGLKCAERTRFLLLYYRMRSPFNFHYILPTQHTQENSEIKSKWKKFQITWSCLSNTPPLSCQSKISPHHSLNPSELPYLKFIPIKLLYRWKL